jgi:hypothetical protein
MSAQWQYKSLVVIYLLTKSLFGCPRVCVDAEQVSDFELLSSMKMIFNVLEIPYTTIMMLLPEYENAILFLLVFSLFLENG